MFMDEASIRNQLVGRSVIGERGNMPPVPDSRHQKHSLANIKVDYTAAVCGELGSIGPVLNSTTTGNLMAGLFKVSLLHSQHITRSGL